MDPITHAALGAAVGYALTGRKLGRHGAVLGALAGITPDIDHFVRSAHDPLLYVEFHRYFTHSLAFSVVGALLPLLPWLFKQSFRAQFRTLWLCAWTAYLSHCLLDASTTWGTQLYWPFSRERVSWDIVAIVDPLFTGVLGGLLIAGLLRQSRPRVICGLALAAAYFCCGAIQHSRAAAVQKLLADGRKHTIERSEVMPTLGNNIVWRSVYLANGTIHADRIRAGWFSRGTAREGTALPLMTTNDFTALEQEGNSHHHAFDRFKWFTGGWLARPVDDATIIGDMRYSRSTEAFDPVWGIRIDADRVEWVSRERNRRFGVGEL
ncbi:MAG TPA: metal-dependent hydrolase [Candidatus Acidoferrum sp.]|nr:metal-dependent hydrolase [Candidatus Acidoferrum sp.]